MSDSDRGRALAANLAAAFLLGAIGGIAWKVRLRQIEISDSQLIDWQRVRQIASALSERGPIDRLSESDKIEHEANYRTIIEQVSPRMLAYLGSGSDKTFAFKAWARVVDRPAWIDANVESFKTIFEPVEDLLRGRMAGRIAQPINQQISSVFMGVLLGYLSRRVLGQYDPSLLGKEALTPGTLFFVEPNLRAARRELVLPRDQFETWIAFHELTHSWQFEAHPWVREFMNRQVRRLITTATDKLVGLDALELLRLAMRGELDFKQPQRMVSAMMTEEQREIFERLQALMCLVEGFSNHVMDALGPDMLPDYAEIARKFESRQGRKSQAEKLFVRLTGLEMKMEQYRVGEAFVHHVVRERGIGFMNRAWESPAHLPSLSEIYRPNDWIARMASSGG